jgi:hypothetical protein
MDLQALGRGRISQKRPPLVLGKKPNGKFRFKIIMRTAHVVVGITVAGLLAGFLSGCAHDRAGASVMEYRIGPIVGGGVTNYPAKPGAIYTNVPAEYTTNPPPPGVDAFVTIITTNGIHIHSIDPVAVPK